MNIEGYVSHSLSAREAASANTFQAYIQTKKMVRGSGLFLPNLTGIPRISLCVG